MKPSADAIWIAAEGSAGFPPRYFRTRAEALAFLADHLAAERSAGRRTLAGFDFPFGYPRGFAAALTGRAAGRAVWAWLASRITDGPANANNRFAVAAEINSALGSTPFWGRPAALALSSLPERGRDRIHPFPERRLVEARVPSAQPAWKLYTTGSVGGQVLMGLPALHRLLHDPRLEGIAAWPFDTGLAVPDAPIVLAEIYPSLLAGAVAGEAGIRDAAQVRLTAGAYAALDAEGALAPLFAPTGLTPEETTIVANEEAWILGVGFEPALRAAAPPRPQRLLRRPPRRRRLDARRHRPRPPPRRDRTRRRARDRPPRRRRRPHPRRPPPRRPRQPAGGERRRRRLRLRPREPRPRPAHPPPPPRPRRRRRPLPRRRPPGHALRILTGALLPEGVDTVVLEEDVTAPTPATITFARGLKPRANTRPPGEDVAEGAEILAEGRRLAPQDLALAAATGLAALPVRRRLRVAVLSTGDEIRPAGGEAAPHQTFDANRPMLLDILRRWDMTPVDLGHAADSRAAVTAALDRGAAQADAILTSGGASAGDEDHVSATLKAAGALEIWRIAVKPGRPLAIGKWQGRPVFGLPGNPVAAFVCTLVFARPVLLRLAGAPWQTPQGLTLPAAFAKAKHAGRREYLRARLGAEGAVEVFPSEGSGRISGLAWATGLVELEDGPRTIRPGDPVRYIPFAEFGL